MKPQDQPGGASGFSASCCACAPVMIRMISMFMNSDQCSRQAVRSSAVAPSMTCQQVVREGSVHEPTMRTCGGRLRPWAANWA